MAHVLGLIFSQLCYWDMKEPLRWHLVEGNRSQGHPLKGIFCPWSHSLSVFLSVCLSYLPPFHGHHKVSGFSLTHAFVTKDCLTIHPLYNPRVTRSSDQGLQLMKPLANINLPCFKFISLSIFVTETERWLIYHSSRQIHSTFPLTSSVYCENDKTEVKFPVTFNL